MKTSASVNALLALAALALVAPLLSGCSPVTYKTVCPTLVPYSMTQQTDLAEELVATPDAPMLHQVVRDYAGLRDQVRACQAEGK
ncbi:hypothetical protein [Acetobacter cerevisiae]|uniref:hypothetical protein n=1 Tax=Acetobacter cerevisiae TaxID=178900 RepID=UPI0020A09DE3|nr:hypothetical protein [Acetobacter cerevisiae]MCP1270911.1 hypothetical protein [Acetobacter cerevisiae]MCP1278858.1 hypothetical protein [Acetobacter cerevisiae]